MKNHMQIFNESPVLETEIDRLGHMNVQHYMARVGRANAELMSAVGLTPQVCDAHELLVRNADLYCRFHREQFAGAVLQVLGGLLELDARRARHYFEIRNPAADQLAASFIIENATVTATERKPSEFPPGIVQLVTPAYIELPVHGAPRSLNLDPPRTNISLAELEAQIVDIGPMGMMSGRFERVVGADDCDQHGYLREGANLMFSGKPPPTDEDGSYGPPVLVTDEGHHFGWAILETRALVFAPPRAGHQLISLGADLALAPKSRHSRRWTFNQDSAELVGINDAVAVALDLDERRAIQIPASMRSVIEQNHLPEFA